jgi:hypothetical protein
MADISMIQLLSNLEALEANIDLFLFIDMRE